MDQAGRLSSLPGAPPPATLAVSLWRLASLLQGKEVL